MAFNRFPGREGDDLGPPPPPFRIRREQVSFGNIGGYNKLIILGVALLLLYILLDVLKSYYIDWLWFDDLGYRSVYAKELTARVGLFFAGVGVFFVFFATNVFFAARPLLQTPAAGLGEIETAALRRLYLLTLIAGTIFFAIVLGAIAGGHWDTYLRWSHREAFGVEDPQFHRDIGFYVFTLPWLRFLAGWLMGVAVLTTIAASALYLMRYLVVGIDYALVSRVKIHLTLLLIVVISLFVFRYWLQTFELALTGSGVFFGAFYTDIHARLPFLYVGIGVGILTAIVLAATMFRSGIGWPLKAMGIWVLVGLLGGVLYPVTVQRLQVAPDELEKERTYIARNIEATRRAFNLDTIEERPFPAAGQVTQEELNAHPETVHNIRLLDVDPLLQTYSQIQRIRPLYGFSDVDIDRYEVNGERRQLMISARELNSSRLPANAQSWVNRRLQFTHGFGVAVSPVNEVVQEGLPNLFVRDIPVQSTAPSLRITQPQIYFGEESEHYVIVDTKAKEFDYPIEDGNVQTVFDADGGVKLGNPLKRALFGWQFKDLNIIISGSLTSDSKILFRRNIVDRVKALAPFLQLDQDPYIVIAEGRLYWVQDAYTTTTNYPYSQPAADGYNYIRNSVKVVINAYDGSTDFYIFDDTDPIIRTWAKIFPDLFKPADAMPEAIRDHVRYPEDLFLAQANAYRTYHITDPNVLYNKEDIWNIPTEITGRGEVPLQPYYVIMRIPGNTSEEFVLFLPLTPARVRNTIAWIAARSDGADYGKLLSFRFPTDSLVFGPSQVESRIDQDPGISSQFSLWNQSGSQVIRGNLLMIPIGRGNLFVEPIYLQAETSQLPELKRVVVVNGSNIAMEPTLEASLRVAFGQAQSTLPNAPIITPSPGAPTLTPTPGAPQPTATPQPASTPGGVSDLARLANESFQRAQEALRNGDFATYATEITKAQDYVRQLAQQTAGQ